MVGRIVSEAMSAKPQMFKASHFHLQRTCSLNSFSPPCLGIVVRRLCKCQNHYQSQASRLLIEPLFSCLACCTPKKRLHCWHGNGLWKSLTVKSKLSKMEIYMYIYFPHSDLSLIFMYTCTNKHVGFYTFIVSMCVYLHI